MPDQRQPPGGPKPAAPLFAAFAGGNQPAPPPAPAGGLFAAYASAPSSGAQASTEAGWLRATSYVPGQDQPAPPPIARQVAEQPVLPEPTPLSALAVVSSDGRVLESLDDEDPAVQLARIRARKALAQERLKPQRRAPDEYALVDSDGEEVEGLAGPAADSLPVLAEDQRDWERALVEERVRRDREKARQRRKERKREKRRERRAADEEAGGTDREGGTEPEDGGGGEEEKKKRKKERKKRKKRGKKSSSSSSSSSEGKPRPKRELTLAVRPAEPPPAEGKFALETRPDANNLAYESLYRLDVAAYKVQRGYQLFQKAAGAVEAAAAETEKRRMWSRRRGGFEDVTEVERGTGGGGTRYFEQIAQEEKSEKGKDRIVDMSREALIKRGLGPALAGGKTRRSVQVFLPLEVIPELDTVGGRWDVKRDEAKLLREKAEERQRAMEARKGPAEAEEEAQRLALFEGETTEDYLMRRTRDLNRRVQANPKDEDGWLAFADFQDEFGRLDARARRRRGAASAAALSMAVVEKKLAVLERGVQMNPGSARLVRAYLAFMSQYADPEKVGFLWETAVEEHPESAQMWRDFIEHQMTDFASLSISKLRGLLARATQALAKHRDALLEEGPGNAAAAREAEVGSLEFLARGVALECHAGYLERAVAVLQALVEFNCFCPDWLAKKGLGPQLAYFEPFWESGVPRIGERGAEGWDRWLEANRDRLDMEAMVRRLQTAVQEAAKRDAEAPPPMPEPPPPQYPPPGFGAFPGQFPAPGAPPGAPGAYPYPFGFAYPLLGGLVPPINPYAYGYPQQPQPPQQQQQQQQQAYPSQPGGMYQLYTPGQPQPPPPQQPAAPAAPAPAAGLPPIPPQFATGSNAVAVARTPAARPPAPAPAPPPPPMPVPPPAYPSFPQPFAYPEAYPQAFPAPPAYSPPAAPGYAPPVPPTYAPPAPVAYPPPVPPSYPSVAAFAQANNGPPHAPSSASFAQANNGPPHAPPAAFTGGPPHPPASAFGLPPAPPPPPPPPPPPQFQAFAPPPPPPPPQEEEEEIGPPRPPPAAEDEMEVEVGPPRPPEAAAAELDSAEERELNRAAVSGKAEARKAARAKAREEAERKRREEEEAARRGGRSSSESEASSGDSISSRRRRRMLERRRRKERRELEEEMEARQEAKRQRLREARAAEAEARRERAQEEEAKEEEDEFGSEEGDARPAGESEGSFESDLEADLASVESDGGAEGGPAEEGGGRWRLTRRAERRRRQRLKRQAERQKEDKSVFWDWLQLEAEREREWGWRPARRPREKAKKEGEAAAAAAGEEEEPERGELDPEAVAGFEDVAPFLVRFTNGDLREELIARLLSFLGAAGSGPAAAPVGPRRCSNDPECLAGALFREGLETEEPPAAPPAAPEADAGAVKAEPAPEDDAEDPFGFKIGVEAEKRAREEKEKLERERREEAQGADVPPSRLHQSALLWPLYDPLSLAPAPPAAHFGASGPFAAPVLLAGEEAAPRAGASRAGRWEAVAFVLEGAVRCHPGNAAFLAAYLEHLAARPPSADLPPLARHAAAAEKKGAGEGAGGPEEARAAAKGLLKRHRSELVLYHVYARLEALLGNPLEARRVYEAALGLCGQLPPAQRRLAPLLARALAELELAVLAPSPDGGAGLTAGRRAVALHALACAPGVADGEKFAALPAGARQGQRCPSGDWVPATRLLRARIAYEQRVSDLVAARKQPAKAPRTYWGEAGELAAGGGPLAALAACYAYLLFLADGLAAACDFYERTAAALAPPKAEGEGPEGALAPPPRELPRGPAGLELESLFVSYVKLLVWAAEAAPPVPPSRLRRALQSALALFPSNGLFLSLFCETEARAQLAGRLRLHFDVACSRPDASAAEWEAAIRSELAGVVAGTRPGAANRARALFDRALSLPGVRGSVPLWRLRVRFEVSQAARATAAQEKQGAGEGRAGREPGLAAAAAANAAVRAYYKAIRAAGWSKRVWTDAIRSGPLRRRIRADELQGLVELMHDKHLRVRSELDEVVDLRAIAAIRAPPAPGPAPAPGPGPAPAPGPGPAPAPGPGPAEADPAAPVDA